MTDLAEFLELVAALPTDRYLSLGVELDGDGGRMLCATLIRRSPEGGWSDKRDPWRFDERPLWGVTADEPGAFGRLMLDAMKRPRG